MSGYERKPKTGGLFPASKTKKDGSPVSENAPKMRGYLVLPNGEEVLLAAWIKVMKDGQKWISLSIDEPKKSAAAASVNEEIPF